MSASTIPLVQPFAARQLPHCCPAQFSRCARIEKRIRNLNNLGDRLCRSPPQVLEDFYPGLSARIYPSPPQKTQRTKIGAEARRRVDRPKVAISTVSNRSGCRGRT